MSFFWQGWGVYEIHFLENQQAKIFCPDYPTFNSRLSDTFGVYFTLGVLVSPKITNSIFWLWATIGVISVIFRWPWVPLILAVVIVVVYAAKRLLRWQSLTKKGYAIHWSSGGYLFEEMYKGLVRSFKLSFTNTEPGHWEFFVPSQDQWHALVPDWAQDRRIEIVQRITQKCQPNDVHYPSDWNA